VISIAYSGSPSCSAKGSGTKLGRPSIAGGAVPFAVHLGPVSSRVLSATNLEARGPLSRDDRPPGQSDLPRLSSALALSGSLQSRPHRIRNEPDVVTQRRS
jgi:hypothetical protein